MPLRAPSDFDIDYRRLLQVFADKGHLVRAFYYTALVEDQEYSPIRPLVDWLDYNGYTMVTKPTKEYTDASGRRKIKGNMDIELAIDMMEMAKHLDHIVLFSGDGDFRRLVEAVQRKGVRVTVVSTIRSSPPMVADELRRQADDLHRPQRPFGEHRPQPQQRPPIDSRGRIEQRWPFVGPTSLQPGPVPLTRQARWHQPPHPRNRPRTARFARGWWSSAQRTARAIPTGTTRPCRALGPRTPAC